MLFGHYTQRNEDTDILENHKKIREKQGLKGNVGPFLPTWALHGLSLPPHRFGRDALSELREDMDLSVLSEGNSSARVPVSECRSRRYGLRTRKGGTGAVNLRLSVSGRCSAALYGACRQARTVGAAVQDGGGGPAKGLGKGRTAGRIPAVSRAARRKNPVAERREHSARRTPLFRIIAPFFRDSPGEPAHGFPSRSSRR